MAIEQPPLVVDPDLLDDLPIPSPYTLAEASVPDRIECVVPISIRPSLIDPKNKGLYVDKAVSPGDILFTIEKPLFAIVEQKNTRLRTCDNCFAYQSVEDKIGTVSTVERDIETAIPFDQCGSCGVHHYCDRKCQREAFEHHHKHECITFVDFLSEEPSAESFIERTDFRFVLRFLSMAKANLLTEATMRDFFTAPIGNLYDFGPSMETSYRNLSLNMKLLAKSPVHEDSVLRILCFAVHQSILMHQPFICQFDRYDISYWDTSSPTRISCGSCYEPFITIMRNDCNANTREYFDGMTYILQANCAIPANTEITRHFSSWNDYEYRRLQFTRKEKLDCKCNLCTRGNLGPTGNLRERMLSVHVSNYKPGLDKELLKEQLAIDHKVIADLRSNGFGYDCPDLRRAYMSIFGGQFELDSRTRTQDYKGSLRLLLTVYYLIDPVACPAPSPEERIKVLHFLTVIAYIGEDSPSKVSEIVLTMPRPLLQANGWPNTRIATFHRNAFKEDLEAGDIPVHTDKDALVKELNVLITGPSEEGIGAEIALSIASSSSPSMIILAGRQKTKTLSVMFLIRRMNPNINVVWIPLNLLDNESIRAAADAIKKLDTEKIHVVINNAGVMGVRNYTTSKQGIEGQFAANYLGHFLLTNLLMDQIIAAREESAVIVNMGSLGYELGEVNLDDGGQNYNAWKAFGQSKTAMLLWNIALGKRLANKGISTLVVHPGTTLETKLLENSSIDQVQLAESYKLAIDRNEGKSLQPQNMVTRQVSAGTIILAALDPAYRALSPAFIVDEKVNSQTRSYATSEQDAEILWKLSEQLVGETFNI
ncbi:putative short-chain dehydrogenase protein [Botrytis fragariae]|uniref:Putative short-chain dehydrogenase protein n=1 Tax=Botrytis fragariae TaxID=1964551 RepID=A0A8H6EGV0_9HELO|nr:putative short-chain dehydrogenase protein [Botrytis fragariae]KAF5871698.1 putative short-chain dehydrogenase protein [Botrytis fragariae]